MKVLDGDARAVSEVPFFNPALPLLGIQRFHPSQQAALLSRDHREQRGQASPIRRPS